MTEKPGFINDPRWQWTMLAAWIAAGIAFSGLLIHMILTPGEPLLALHVERLIGVAGATVVIGCLLVEALADGLKWLQGIVRARD